MHHLLAAHPLLVVPALSVGWLLAAGGSALVLGRAVTIAEHRASRVRSDA